MYLGDEKEKENPRDNQIIKFFRLNVLQNYVPRKIYLNEI